MFPRGGSKRSYEKALTHHQKHLEEHRQAWTPFKSPAFEHTQDEEEDEEDPLTTQEHDSPNEMPKLTFKPRTKCRGKRMCSEGPTEIVNKKSKSEKGKMQTQTKKKKELLTKYTSIEKNSNQKRNSISLQQHKKQEQTPEKQYPLKKNKNRG